MNIIKLKKIGLLSGVALSLLATSYAAKAEKSFYVGAYGGYGFGKSLKKEKDGLKLKGGIHLGVKGGYILPSGFFIEADLGYSQGKGKSVGKSLAEDIPLRFGFTGTTTNYLQTAGGFYDADGNISDKLIDEYRDATGIKDGKASSGSTGATGDGPQVDGFSDVVITDADLRTGSFKVEGPLKRSGAASAGMPGIKSGGEAPADDIAEATGFMFSIIDLNGFLLGDAEITLQEFKEYLDNFGDENSSLEGTAGVAKGIIDVIEERGNTSDSKLEKGAELIHKKSTEARTKALGILDVIDKAKIKDTTKLANLEVELANKKAEIKYSLKTISLGLNIGYRFDDISEGFTPYVSAGPSLFHVKKTTTLAVGKEITKKSVSGIVLGANVKFGAVFPLTDTLHADFGGKIEYIGLTKLKGATDDVSRIRYTLFGGFGLAF